MESACGERVFIQHSTVGAVARGKIQYFLFISPPSSDFLVTWSHKSSMQFMI